MDAVHLSLGEGGYKHGKFKWDSDRKKLLTPFAGESQARNRYTYFASQAKKEGYVQMSDIFTETANQEKEHAKRLFKFLQGGEVEILAAFPAGVIGTTLENLKAAAAGEHYEYTEMYPGFAKTARKEGFNDIADVLERLLLQKSSMRSDILTLQPILKQLAFSNGMKRLHGAVATAVISMKVMKRLKCVRLVITRRPILSCLVRTTNFI